MEPPAEVVHWMFGVGFLFLGLCLLAETIVGREVWRRRSWRAYLWPSVAFLMGILMWPVMVFYTSSAIHMLAHGAWAQTMMLAGMAQLGLVRGKLRSPLWELTAPVGVRRLRGRVPDPRAEPLALLAGGVPPPRARLDGLIGGLICLGRARSSALARVQRGVRVHDHRLRLLALLRPERRADLRASLAARRRAMRAKALAAASLVALALPASALAHANLLDRTPTYGSRAREIAAGDLAAVRPGRRRLVERDRRSLVHREGRHRRAGAHGATAAESRPSRCARCPRAPTRSAGT